MAVELGVMEDARLVELARNGDESAKDKLINHYIHLAMWTLPKKVRSSKDADDVDFQQNAKLDMWRAILDFDPSYNRGLPALIVTYVRNGYLNGLRPLMRQKRMFPTLFSLSQESYFDLTFEETIGLEAIAETYDLDVKNQFETFEDEEHLKTLLNKVIQIAEDNGTKQAKVVSLLLQGKSYDEIAAILGTNYTNVTSLRTWGVNSIKKKIELEKKIREFVYGKVPPPEGYFDIRNGGLTMQRIALKVLQNRIGYPIEKLPGDILYKFTSYRKGRKSKTFLSKKADTINKLLPEEERKGDWCYHQVPKWVGKNSKSKAFNAMEEMVMKYGYVVSSSLYDKAPWLDSMVKKLFEQRPNDANLDFQKKRLKLDDTQRQKLLLLKYVTDNDSNIIKGAYQTARDKILDHIDKLDEIVLNTNLTERQKKVFDLWLRGYSWDKIVDNMPNEFKGSDGKAYIRARYDMRLVKNKVKAKAIEMYRSQFEKEADLKELRQQIIEKYNSGKELNIFDRYFRLRLGIIINQMAKDNGWSFERLPYIMNLKNTIRLRNILDVFNDSIKDTVQFAFPGIFPDWQFYYMYKWDGNDGREKAFETIDDVLRLTGKFLFTKKESSYYRLSTMVRTNFGCKNYSELNECYVEEYLMNKLDFSGVEFKEYVKNRKLLSLIFDTKGAKKIEKRPKITDEQLLNLDRHALYQDAGLSELEQEEFEFRLTCWNYRYNSSKTKEIAEFYNRRIKSVLKRFVEARKKIANTLTKLYVGYSGTPAYKKLVIIPTTA